MTSPFLKIAGICAGCSLLAASAWAQAASPGQQPNDSSTARSWSTKRLSATGRNPEKPVRASQLNGSQVNSPAGQRIGTVRDVIIDPSSGRVDFALLSFDATGAETVITNQTLSGKLVPVPWSLLKNSVASSQYANSPEQPTFTLNVDPNKLNSAPTFNSTDWGESEWRQRVYSYYGVTPGPVGGAESPSGVIKGEGVRHLQNSTPEHQPPPMPDK
jgi:sporulation protein YlmC with PRC-barrel domain